MTQKSGKTLRLPTEDEWYRLRDLNDIPDQPCRKRREISIWNTGPRRVR